MNLRFFTLYLSLFLTNYVSALALDQQEALLIEANHGVVDEKSSSTIYSGNVSLIQGSLQILADEVQVKTNENGDVVEVIATSHQASNKPASIKKQSENKGEIHATAWQIQYRVEKQQVQLSGNAHVQQNNHEFSGELVYYDIEKGIVNINRGQNSTGRVKIKYDTAK